MELDISLEEPWPAGEWPAEWEALAARATAAAVQVGPELASPRLTASLLLTSDRQIRELNRDWRGRDQPTNVLSFPMLGRAELLALAAEGPPVLLGDIALAYETCAREAAERELAVEDHAAHLLVHGLLHLAGYDHEISPAEAEAMEALETKALAMCGIADPYGVRDA